jgi:hypothetical protein
MSYINNFEQIAKLLSFDDSDTFYHLQIIKRKKENPELGSNSYIVKTYYISSEDYLSSKMTEIISLCDFHNARAYINLNPRSFEKMAFHALKKITDIILNKDYKSARKAYESVCGQYSSGKEKSWIIDLDGVFEASPLMMAHIDYGCDPISESTSEGKCLAVIRTKNGIHLITKPFNVKKFQDKYPDIDIHKNNPTILYTKI